MQNMTYQYNNYLHGLKNEYGSNLSLTINKKKQKIQKIKKFDIRKITTFHLIRCWQPLQLFLSILYIDFIH